MGLVPLIDDLRIGGSDHTHKTAHYTDLTAEQSSSNSGGRLKSINGRHQRDGRLIARIKALLRRPGGRGNDARSRQCRLDTGRELAIGGIPVGCTENTSRSHGSIAGEDQTLPQLVREILLRASVTLPARFDGLSAGENF